MNEIKKSDMIKNETVKKDVISEQQKTIDELKFQNSEMAKILETKKELSVTKSESIKSKIDFMERVNGKYLSEATNRIPVSIRGSERDRAISDAKVVSVKYSMEEINKLKAQLG